MLPRVTRTMPNAVTNPARPRAGSAPEAPASSARPTEPPQQIRRRRRWPWLLLVAGLIVGLGAAGWSRPDYYTIEIGPLALPANSGHGEVEQPRMVAMELPIDGWIRGLRYELVDERGVQVPTSMLHHLNLIVPTRRELFSQIMLRIGAAGPETGSYTLPSFLGYRVRPGDSLLVTAMLHNPSDTAYRGVQLRVQLAMSSAASWLRPLSISPVYLDVMPPAGAHSFDLPPGRSTKVWEGRPAVPVRLLAAGSHLHEYGTGLRLEDVTTGKVLWTARPKLDDRGKVIGMPRRYFLPFGVQLDPDHVYRLTAEYDNPTGKVLEDGGMGALGGIVLPASGTVWPGVARSDSVYQHDRAVTGRDDHAANGHGHH
jgi:hypothetical protein